LDGFFFSSSSSSSSSCYYYYYYYYYYQVLSWQFWARCGQNAVIIEADRIKMTDPIFQVQSGGGGGEEEEEE